MKIIHLVPNLFGKFGVVGGAERYAHELARSMAELENTTLLTFGEKSSETMVGKLNIRVIGNPYYIRGQTSNPFSWRLFHYLSQADVIHCHQTHILSSSLSALYGMLTRRPVFTSDLGGGGWDISGYISTNRWFRGHLHISKYSEMIAGHQGQPWSHVIYGGVDPIKFSPSPEHRESNVIVYVGRLLAHKGINYLIEALPENLCLRIIGNAYNSEYFDLLKNLAKGKNVKFETDCDDPTIVRAYQDALCVVLPSVYRDYYGKETKVPELLGQTLLEGMASGVPVICTDVASMPEIVSDSVTGFVVPPNDPEALRNKLSWLGDHPKETHQMGQAARQSILDRFNWASVARKCIEIYKR